MRRKKKILTAVLLCLSMAVSGLTGCGGGNSVSLFTEGEANFIIVRSADADSVTAEIAGNLRETIKEKLGVTVNYKPDTIKHTDGQLEINIGITNRPDSQAVYDEVANESKTNSMDYIIKHTGDYIYIVGMSSEALQNAVDYFAENFLSDTKGSVAGNYNYIHNYKGNGKMFSINGSTELASYKIVTPKYNMSYLVGREIETLNNNLMIANGVLLEEITDWDEESECEIIIDHTTREGAPQPKDSDEYRIKVDGTKVYLIGGSTEATAVAVKEFNQMIADGGSIDENTDITGSYAETTKKYDDYYAMTWNDEFDSFDSSKWRFMQGKTTNGILPEGDTRYTNYTDSPKNHWYEDGKLYMKATMESDRYDSPEIRTDHSTWFKYGLIETSVQIKNGHGQGAAFWLLGNSAQDYYAEIDIYEASGNFAKFTPLSWVSKALQGQGINSGTYYCDFQGDIKVYDGGTKGDTYFRFEGDDMGEYFHTFGIEWTEDSMTSFVDGRKFIRINTTVDERAVATFNNYMQIILAHGGGGVTAGIQVVDETSDWENNFSCFDYIRLYQTSIGEIKYR